MKGSSFVNINHGPAMVINTACLCIPGSVNVDQCCLQVKSGATRATNGRDPQPQHAPTTTQSQVSTLPQLQYVPTTTQKIVTSGADL